LSDQLPLYNSIGATEHTQGHISCPACEAVRRKIKFSLHLSPYQPFHEAAGLWLESLELAGSVTRAHYMAPRTLKDNQQYVRALMRFFGLMRLDDIHPGHLCQYQFDRSAGNLGIEAELVMARCAKRRGVRVDQLSDDPGLWAWTQQQISASRVPVNPTKINQELGTLERILKRAALWGTEFTESYKPLQVTPSDVPRSMSPEEQELFFEVAASRPEWRFAYLYCLLALESAMTNCEMRGLHVADVNLFEQVAQVRAAHAKNRGRIRTIPLPEDALWAADLLVQRAHALGATAPTHFLFPYCMGGGGEIFDPRRPMSESGIKRAFLAIRKEANVPWLRHHDLRHCGITRMAESGMAMATIMAIAGHTFSPEMTQHYTQISMQAKRKDMTKAFGRRATDSRMRPGRAPSYERRNPTAAEPASIPGRTSPNNERGALPILIRTAGE
jgi:integrase